MTDEQFRSALNELAAEALKGMRRKRTTKQMTTREAISWIESLESTDKEQAEAKRIAIDALTEREKRKNEVCGKCACYDRQFSYCNKLGVTFADDDFCSCFEQKEVDE